MSDAPVVKEFAIPFLAKLVRDPLAYLGELQQQYGDLCTKKILGTPHYFLFHPSHAEHVLSENQDNFRKYPPLVSNFKPFLGTENLLTTNDATQWQRDRDLCKTAFEAEVYFERYAETMVRKYKASMDEWQKRFAAPGALCPIGPEFDRIALETIRETLFHGLDIDIEAMVRHIPRIFELIVKKATSVTKLPWVFPSRVKRRYQSEVRFLEQAKIRALQTRLSQGKDVDDLLGTLLAYYRVRDIQNPHVPLVTNQMMTFNVAGYGSTTSAMRWVAMALIDNPGDERRVASEVQSVCRGRDPGYEDFEKLEYTRAFIMEVLRLYPPFALLAREVVGEDSLGSYRLPAGAAVVLSVHHIHRHPAHWSDAESFKPERFLTNPYGQDDHFAYLPFGAGRRSCLGRNFALLELTLLTAMLVRRFGFELPKGFQLRREYVGSIFVRPNLESVALKERDS
jgi:cytochrome P450